METAIVSASRASTPLLPLAQFLRILLVMTRLVPDPELEQLVRELNERDAAVEGERSAWPSAQVPSGNPLEALLIDVARRGASDLLLISGSQPVFRVGGRLVRGDGATLSGDDVAAIVETFLTPRVRQRLTEDGAVDFSLRLAAPE